MSHSSPLNATLRHLCLHPVSLLAQASRHLISFCSIAQSSCQGVLAAIARDHLDIYYTVTHHWRLICFYTVRGRLTVDLSMDLAAFWIIHMPFLLTLWLFHPPPPFFFVLFLITVTLIFVAFLCCIFFSAARLSGANSKVRDRDMEKEVRYLVRCASRAGSQDWSVLPSVFDSSFAFNSDKSFAFFHLVRNSFDCLFYSSYSQHKTCFPDFLPSLSLPVSFARL